MSSTCKREVRLADTLGKPIALLMLETMNWPSAGAVGMTLANTHYIQCSEARVQDNWRSEEFQQLLARIEKLHADVVTSGRNSATRDKSSQFDAKREWAKLRNVGRAAAQLQKGSAKTTTKSSTCAVM